MAAALFASDASKGCMQDGDKFQKRCVAQLLHQNRNIINLKFQWGNRSRQARSKRPPLSRYRVTNESTTSLCNNTLGKRGNSGSAAKRIEFLQRLIHKL